MDYAEALKEIRAKKPVDNYLVIKFGYDANLVLPYKDGLAFIESLKNAEQFDRAYTPTRIDQFNRTCMEITVMSREEYEQYKLSMLLGITLEEAKQLQTPKPQTSDTESS